MENENTNNIPENRTEERVSYPKVSSGDDKRKSSKKLLKILFALLILGGLIVGTWYLLKEPQFDQEEEENITPTVFEEEEPTPTAVSIEREDVKIEVLNGTGISGEAAYLQGQLRNLGYENIDAGNASDQNYTTTEVTFDSDLPEEVRKEIIEKLEELYKSVESSTKSLSEFDVQIIIGLRKGQSAKPTPTTSKTTPTPTPKTTGTVSPTPTPTKTPTPTP